MKTILFCTLVLCFCITAPAYARDIAPNVPDFVNEGTLAGTFTCDAGTTKFSSYDIGKRGWGMAITINGKIRYYIFSPNPNSMSPETWSFIVSDEGHVTNITINQRNKGFQTEAPQLYTFLASQGRAKSDCFTQRLLPKKHKH